MSRLAAFMLSVWLLILAIISSATPAIAAAPTITSFSPKGGKVGDVITITGTNFAGATTVKFNTTAASEFSVVSDTSITATVPAGATTGYISVTSSDFIKATSKTAFAVYYAPTITSFSPTNGHTGQLVTISGTNFSAVTGVSFNGTPVLSYTVDSSMQISTYVPAGATTGPIAITTSYFVVGSTDDFTVNPPLVQSGTIEAWGSLNVAQGTYNGFTAISAGYNHLLGLKRDGSVVGIGDNTYGKCVVPEPNMDFVSVAAGYYHSVGLKRDGSIVCWGTNSSGQCTVPEPNSDFIAIAAGQELSAGIKSDGRVVFWGIGKFGQADIPEPNISFAAVTVIGQYHAMGLRRDGSLVPWGYDYGLTRYLPTPNQDFTAIASGTDYEMGLKRDGSIVSWGANLFPLPTPNRDFTAITSSWTHAAGLKSDSSLAAWGNNDAGQCNIPEPNNGFMAVSAGNGFTAAIRITPPPTISSFTPTSGKVGQEVTITGTNFTGTTDVDFNGTVAAYTVNSDTSITTHVPSGATSGPISVTNGGGTATSNDVFTVYQPPTITSFTPTSGIIGQEVTISGTNFTGTTDVNFNGTSAIFTVNSDISITTHVPVGTTSGKISVTNLGGSTTSADIFTVILAPTISSFTPTSGNAGASVTITGTNFIGITNVSFNGTSATFKVNSSTSIITTVPTEATTGKITVTNAAGTATSALDFTAFKPTLTSFSPKTGKVGDSIVITGTYFTPGSIVKLNSALVTDRTVTSATSITAVVPDGATSGKISVTTPGGTATSSDDFIVAPTITSFAPDSGKIGDIVTIIGLNFTGTTAVTFNGLAASTFNVVSDTSITVTIPDNATSGKISVTAPGGTATSATDFYVAPTITSFAPESGKAGDIITISGTNFKGATVVKFNGLAATAFTVVNNTSITVTVPNNATSGKVSVTTPGGTATSVTNFYVAPTITSFAPEFGKVGDIITITGSNFTGATAVTINELPATAFTVVNNTSMTVTVPNNATSGRISVTTPGGTATSATDFYVAPTITSIAPESGKGGDIVTISGTNLTGATTVKFNGLAATAFTVVNNTSITVTVPNNATSGKISVTTPGGTATSATDFYVAPTITSFAPESGKVGDVITINGTNFAGASAVSLNGTNVPTFTVVSNTTLTAKVSNEATTGKFAITTPGGTATSEIDFTVYQLPTITSFAPEFGKVGDVITITGTNFAGASGVAFNGLAATAFTVVTNTSITVTVPNNATSGKISVTTPGGTATSATDFYVAPTIASFAPEFGKVGDIITITGTNFMGATAVTINGLAATAYTVVNNTSMTVTVPNNATSGKISITTPGGSATSATDFYVAPTITSFAPESGKAGDVITITGTNFTSATTVKFNGLEATAYTVVNNTSITATVPNNATSGRISVSTPGGTATSETDFYVEPTITSFAPESGKVGDVITITGTNFTGASAVSLNSTNVLTFTVVSRTSLTAKVPDGATTGKFAITTPGGTATSKNDFTVYQLPTITSFAPESGKVGDVITITGTNFTGATAVKINGLEATAYTVVSDTSISVTVPNNATSGRISVTAPGGTATSATDFYVAPTITSFAPGSGKVGDIITITGTNLTGTTTVKFNDSAATTYTVVSDTSITVTVPDKATSGKISVTTNGGTATSATNFYVAPTITSFAPGFGKVGDIITITGTNLTGTTTVKFNGLAATTYNVVTDTSITVTVPNKATSGKISVTTPGGTATSTTDFYVAPTLISFTPDNGKIGDIVTITGTNLTGATAVTFNGLAATTYTVVNDTSINVTVPEGATSGKISVTTNGGTATSATDFIVYHLTSLEITVDPGAGYIGLLGKITLNYNLNGSTTYSGKLSFDNSGKSLINGLKPGTYDLTLSGSHWLRRVLHDINVDGINGVNALLANGDANGDGQVNLFDFVVLDMNFGSTDSMADLDGDGNVNLFDYMIIDMNFGAQAD